MGLLGIAFRSALYHVVIGALLSVFGFSWIIVGVVTSLCFMIVCCIGWPMLLIVFPCNALLSRFDARLLNWVAGSEQIAPLKVTWKFTPVTRTILGYLKTRRPYLDVLYWGLFKFGWALAAFCLVVSLLGSIAVSLSPSVLWWTCNRCFRQHAFCLGEFLYYGQTGGGCRGWEIHQYYQALLLCLFGVILVGITFVVLQLLSKASTALAKCFVQEPASEDDDGYVLIAPEEREMTGQRSVPEAQA